MKRLLLLIILCSTGWLATTAQPLCHATFYDEEDGVPSGHVTQLLQDRQGFMWFATWNGLCRYDGYEFQTFKPIAGDSCRMGTDRIRDIGLLPDGRILCRVDDAFFLFNPHSCRFTDCPDPLTPEQAQRYRQSQSLKPEHDIRWIDAYHTTWTLTHTGRLTYQTLDGQQGVYPESIALPSASFACTDRQGNLWVLTGSGICRLSTGMSQTQRLEINPPSEVKCLYADRQGRYWISTKDGALRAYSTTDDRLSGYLGADGRLHQTYTRLPAPVYAMLEQADGTLWLGTKPDGLYRLRPQMQGGFEVTHMEGLPDGSVYHIAEDRQGRLWVATLGGGLCYTAQPKADKPQFAVPAGYPKDRGQRVRFVLISRNEMLLAATTDGLMVAQIAAEADDMQFRCHGREPERTTSLSSSATMDIVETADGRILVSTESGGINQTTEAQLLADTLTFTHINVANHQLPSDIALSQTALPDGGLMVVGGHLVTLFDHTGARRVLDARYFNADYRFSEAHPLALSDGRWLFALADGAFVTSTTQMLRPAYTPPLMLTHISVQGSLSRWDVVVADTLTLQPDERSLTLHFAALEYSAPERIAYAFRIMGEDAVDSTLWNYIGRNRSATLLDLKPGTWHVEVRCTNADGQWSRQTRSLTLVVLPTFWESAWGRLLLFLLLTATIGTIVCTIFYIRRIKRKQHDTLAAYLALLETRSQDPQPEPVGAEISLELPTGSLPTDLKQDPILQRVKAFIEANLSNSDANVGDMAAAAAVSRSGLQRKLKQTMGITPLDLLREARIKHACLMLRQTEKSIADVAYACGFTDPKYFSRCFKQSTGVSPSDYKNG